MAQWTPREIAISGGGPVPGRKKKREAAIFERKRKLTRIIAPITNLWRAQLIDRAAVCHPCKEARDRARRGNAGRE